MAVLKNMRKRHPSAGMLLDVVSIGAEIARPVERSRTSEAVPLHLAPADVSPWDVAPRRARA